MMTCKICSHASRAAIDAAIVDQRSLRDIARQFDIHRSSLDRHKKHIPKALTNARQAETVAESTTLLSRLEKLISRCELIFEKASAGSKWSGAAAAAREIRGCLELLAKLSGELKPGGVTVNNNLSFTATVEQMTDDELEAAIGNFIVEHGFGLTEVRKSILFDEVTVPPGLGYETNRRYDSSSPWRNASPSDRYRMLQAAWKRETGEDLSEQLSDLGSRVVIEIGFDFAEERDWMAWPTVKLLRPGGFGFVTRQIDGTFQAEETDEGKSSKH